MLYRYSYTAVACSSRRRERLAGPASGTVGTPFMHVALRLRRTRRRAVSQMVQLRRYKILFNFFF
jgi:hypothetical protein